MTFTWFQPPTPSGDSSAVMAERLQPIGVRVKAWQRTPPPVSYQVDRGQLIAQVGFLVVVPASGEINVYPCADIGESEMRTLLGCAQRAFEQPPTRSNGWRYLQRGGRRRFETAIYVKVDDGEAVAHAVAQHQLSMRQSALVTLGDACLEVAG